MKKMIRRVVCALCAFFVLSVVLPESISEFGFFSKLSAGLAEGTAPTRPVASLPESELNEPVISGEWVYAARALDGYAVITGYTGASNTPAIPTQLGGTDVVGIASGALEGSSVVTIPGSVTNIAANAFGDSKPEIRALNGSAALAFAAENSLPFTNTSKYVLVPDVVDFSDAPAGRVAKRGEQHVRFGVLEARRVSEGDVFWMLDARGDDWFYKIVSLSPSEDGMLAEVVRPEIAEVIIQANVETTVTSTVENFSAAPGVQMISSDDTERAIYDYTESNKKPTFIQKFPLGFKENGSGGSTLSLGKTLFNAKSDTLFDGYNSSITGTLDISFDISVTEQVTVQIENGKIVYARCVETTVIDKTVSTSLKGKATQLLKQDLITCYSQAESNIAYMVLPTTWFTVKGTISAGVSLTGSLSYTATDVRTEIREYDTLMQKWNVVATHARTDTTPDSWQLSASVAGKVYAKASISLKLVGIITVIEGEAEFGFKFSAQKVLASQNDPSTHPCLRISSDIYAEITVTALSGLSPIELYKKEFNSLDLTGMPPTELHVTPEHQVYLADACPYGYGNLSITFNPLNGIKLPLVRVMKGEPCSFDEAHSVTSQHGVESMGRFLGWSTDLSVDPDDYVSAPYDCKPDDLEDWEIDDMDWDDYERGLLYTDTFLVHNAMKFYGVWENTARITFDAAPSYSTIPPQYAPVGGYVARPDPPRYYGNTFLYWYRLDQNGLPVVWDFDRDTVPAEGLTLHARWVDGSFTYGSGAQAPFYIGSIEDVSNVPEISSASWDDTPDDFVSQAFDAIYSEMNTQYFNYSVVKLENEAVGVNITGIKGDPVDLVIPNRIYDEGTGKTLNVMGFNYGALANQTSLRTVVFLYSNGLDTNQLFQGCTHLEYVDLSHTLMTTVNTGAFDGCTALRCVRLPAGVSVIESSAFRNCESLSELKLPEGIQKIGDQAFAECKGITILDKDSFPASLEEIGQYVFYGCTGLRSITLPDTFTKIADDMFSGCSALTGIDFGAGVTSIGYRAFRNCTSLESVYIPDNVTMISYGIDSGAVNAEYFYYGKISGFGTSENFSAVFFGCTSLKHISVGGVDTIKPYMLYSGSTVLTEVEVRGSVKHIDTNAFSVCSATLEKLTLGEGLETIGIEAFKSCEKLREVTLPETLTSLGAGAFMDCKSLLRLRIPDSLKSIPYQAFQGCSALIELDLGEGVEEIADLAFSNLLSLESLTIPDSVKSLGYYSSPFEGCIALKRISAGGPKTIDAYAMKTDSSVLEDVEVRGTVDRIDRNTFSQYAASLKTVRILDGVTTIGESAFRDCASITVLRLPETLQTIEAYAFQGCAGLTELDFSDKPGCQLYNMAFQGCTGLTRISLPNTFASNTFQGCAAVQAVTVRGNGKVPDTGSSALKEVCFEGITSLPTDACATCADSLERVVLCEGLNGIGRSAFGSCARMKEVYLPDSLTSIQDSAFANCTALEYLRTGENISYISTEALTGCNCPGITVVCGNDYARGVFERLGCVCITPDEATVTVTWDANGGLLDDGESARSITLLRGAPLSAPVPAWENHAFSGWLDTADTLLTSVSSAPKYNETYRAAWDVNTYKLILDPMDSRLETVVLEIAADQALPLEPLRMDGYDFDGWFLDETLTVRPPARMPEADLTLYAAWVRISVNGEYSFVDGKAILTRYEMVEYENPAIALPEDVDGCPVTGIADNAFNGIPAISIRLPANLTTLAPKAFRGATALKNIYVDADNTHFTSVAGVLYNSDQSRLLRFPPMHSNSLVLPHTVQSVADYACEDSLLENIKLNWELVSIGNYAFANARLKMVEFEDAKWAGSEAAGAENRLRTIGDYAFYGNASLAEFSTQLDYGWGIDAQRNEIYFERYLPIESIGVNALEGCQPFLTVFGPIESSAMRTYAEAHGHIYNPFTLKINGTEQTVQAGSSLADIMRQFKPPENHKSLGFYGDTYFNAKSILWTEDMPMPACYLTLTHRTQQMYNYRTESAGDSTAYLVLTKYLIADDRNPVVPEKLFSALGPVGQLSSGCFTQEMDTLTLPASLILIEENAIPESDTLVICCPAGSYAEQWAAEHGYHVDNSPDDGGIGQEPHTLTFETNGGSLIEPMMLAAGTTFELPVTVKSGCEFSGWYLDAEFTQAAPTSQDGTFIMSDANLTLYAAWTVVDEDAATHDFTFEEVNGEIYVTGPAEGLTVVVIESEINGLPVTTVADGAFAWSDLRSITLPESIKSLGTQAFERCEFLYSINGGDGITEIGDACFSGCRNTTSFDFLDSVERIGSKAFSNSGARVITLPASLKRIAPDAFEDCRQLWSLTVDPDNPYYEMSGNGLYDRENLTLIFYLKRSDTVSYQIKAETCAIGAGAFSDVTNLKEVILSDSVFEIGIRAFECCYDLETLPSLTNSLITTIPAQCFRGCAALTEITIPENITAIGQMAFADCAGLQSVFLPASVASIAEDAFSGCDPVFYGEAGSAAEAWANSHGFLFNSGDMVFPESLTLNLSELYLKRGERAPLSASLQPEDAYETVSWLSLDPGVATVNRAGVVHAIAGGDTTIYAITVNGITAGCQVHVDRAVPVERVEVTTAYRNINPGETAELTVTVLPEYATNKAVSFASSDESVISVDPNGVLTAHRGGEATITVTALDGSGAVGMISLEVQQYIEQIILEPCYYAWEDEVLWLTATVLPETADATAIKWSGNSLVDYDGKFWVGPSSLSSVDIVCSATDGSGITARSSIVIRHRIQTVKLAYSYEEMYIGETFSLQSNRTILPSYGYAPGWLWFSSDESVVTVDENGLVTTVGPGTAYVTCQVDDALGTMSDACEFRVFPDLDTIQFNAPDHIDLHMRKTMTVRAFLPRAYRYQSFPVIWESSNPNIVSVSDDPSGSMLPVVPRMAAIEAGISLGGGESASNGNSSCKLQPVGPGTAIITARLSDSTGEPASIEVFVSPVIERITLEGGTFAVGTPFSVKVSLEPEGAITDSLTWTTGYYLTYNESTGTFYCDYPGRYQITATANDGSGAQGSCIVELMNGVESITLNQTSLLLWEEESSQLTANVKPISAYQTLAWNSSNPQVVMVDENGFVQAVGLGRAVITARAMDGTGVTAQCEVQVCREVTDFEIIAPSVSGFPGESIPLQGAAYPVREEDRFNWVSDDPEVATVDENGRVTLLKPGIVTITAGADWTGLTASVDIECRGDKVLRVTGQIYRIEEEAFANDGFEIIEFGPDVRYVDNLAFANCINLYKVIVHGEDTYFYSKAFEGCGNLTFVAPVNSRAHDFANWIGARFREIDEQ